MNGGRRCDKKKEGGEGVRGGREGEERIRVRGSEGDQAGRKRGRRKKGGWGEREV